MESTTKSRVEILSEITTFISQFECVSHVCFETDLISICIHPTKSTKLSGFFVFCLCEICEKYALAQVDILSDSNVPYVKIQLVK